MNGGMASPLQVLTSTDTGTMLSRVAIMQQLQLENGDRVTALSTAEAAAQRAHDTAVQQAKRVATLSTQMAKQKQVIQGKVNTLNSAAFAKAMTIFQQTGNYPTINLPTANTVGEQALQAALTRRGDPYVWGAAGPERVRLLRPGQVGLRAGGHQPAALHGVPVEHGRAHLEEPARTR